MTLDFIEEAAELLEKQAEKEDTIYCVIVGQLGSTTRHIYGNFYTPEQEEAMIHAVQEKARINREISDAE